MRLFMYNRMLDCIMRHGCACSGITRGLTSPMRITTDAALMPVAELNASPHSINLTAKQFIDELLIDELLLLHYSFTYPSFSPPSLRRRHKRQDAP